MRRFLLSVYKVIFSLDSEMTEVNTYEIARSTTERCFTEATGDSAATRLDFDQFRAWITSDGSRGLKDGVLKAAVMVPLQATIREVAAITGLNRVPANEVLETLTAAGDDDGSIDLKSFLAAFRENYFPHMSSIEYNRARLLFTRLFRLFDQDNNGVVDCVEMSVGLVKLCAGSRDKVMEAFALYDRNSGAQCSACCAVAGCGWHPVVAQCWSGSNNN